MNKKILYYLGYSLLGLLIISSLSYFLVDYFSDSITVPTAQESGFSNLLTPKESQSSEKPDSTIIPSPTPEPTLPPVPTQKTLLGGTHVYQTFNNCGPASLSMTLSYYGITQSQAELGQELRPYQNAIGDNDDKSVTLEELVLKAEELGFSAYHRPAGNMEMITKFVANDIPVIARTWLKPDDTIGHYRVVKGYDTSREIIIQDDSLQGKDLEYSYERFNRIWQAFNYEFLVLIPEEKIEVAELILGDLYDNNTAWQKAVEQANHQLSSNPNDIYARFNLAVAYYELGQYQKSIEAYESVESQLPFRMLWYQIEPIMSYYKLGQYDQVMQISDSILTNQNYGFSELHCLQGLIYQERNQSGLANTSFSRANQFNHSQGIWMINLE